MQNSSQIISSLLELKKSRPFSKDTLSKAMHIFSEQCDLNNECMCKDYSKSLIKGMIKSVVENKEISNKDISKILESVTLNPDTKKDITESWLIYKDTKRVEENHKIISKRFDIEKLLQDADYVSISDYFHNHVIYFKICSLLSTYNSLSVAELIELAFEECSYIAAKYNQKVSFYEIFESVLCCVLDIFEPPVDNIEAINKFIEDTESRIAHSAYLNNLLRREHSEFYIERNKDEIKDTIVRAVYKRDIKSLLITVPFLYNDSNNDLNTIINLQYYFIYTGKHYKEIKSILLRSIKKLIDNGTSFSDITRYLDRIHKTVANYPGDKWCYVDYSIKEDIPNLFAFLYKLAPNMFENGVALKEAVEHPLLKDPAENQFDFSTDFSDYEKKIERTFDEAYATFDAATRLDKKSFDLTFGNPYVIVNESVDTIKDIANIAVKYPYVFDVPKLSFAYKKARDMIKIESAPTDYDNLTRKTILSKMINLFNYDFPHQDENQVMMYNDDKDSFNINNIDSIKNSVDDNKKAMALLVETVSTVNKYSHELLRELRYQDNSQEDMSSDNNNDTYTIPSNKDSNKQGMLYEAVTITDNGKKILQEMKLSSYATLALDKIKRGYDKLDDTQKSAFRTIDAIADSVEKWDDKEDSAEARKMIVNNKIIPSMSRCIKTILMAGALSFISVYLAIVALAVKFVNTRNARKQERQAIVDELEVEIQMVDRRIRDAEDDKDYDKERRYRILKKKMITQYGRLAIDNATKWNNELVMKSDTDKVASHIGLSED